MKILDAVRAFLAPPTEELVGPNPIAERIGPDAVPEDQRRYLALRVQRHRPNRRPKVYDIRERRWGRNVEMLGRNEDGSWSAGVVYDGPVEAGDYVLLRGRIDGVEQDVRYIVLGPVTRRMDPGDVTTCDLFCDGPAGERVPDADAHTPAWWA